MGILGEVEGVVGAMSAVFKLPSSVLTALNCGSLVLALPPPVTDGLVVRADDLDRAKAPQPVGHDHGPRWPATSPPTSPPPRW